MQSGDTAGSAPPSPGAAAELPRGGFLVRRIQILMLGRVVFITALLGATLWLGEVDQTLGRPRQLWLSGLAVAVYGLTIVYALWLRRGAGLGTLASAQALGDVLFATTLTWVTGGPESTWLFLFLLAAIGASLLLPRGGALAVTTLGAGLFVLTSVLEATQLMPFVPGVEHLPPGYATGRLWLALFVNVAAMYAVAVLTSLLSEQARRVGKRLDETRADLDALGRLHADIVQSLYSGVLTLGDDGRIMSANPAAQKMLGRDEAALRALDAAGAHALLALPPASEARYETRAAERELGVQVVPLRAADGDTRGRLVIFSDLTELRHAEAALRRAEAFAALGRMAARLAHEIRNPLSAISGAVEVLGTGGPHAAEEPRLVEIVRLETARLDGLLTDLLDLARPRAALRVRTDLAILVRETEAVFRRDPVLDGRRLVVEWEGEATPLWVEADPGRIKQALWNLLRNAAQATPDGGEIRVALRRDGEAAVVRVRDQGPGVPAAERERIFEPFFTTRPTGSGIGLAVVRSAADAHGGTVTVCDAPGGGAELVLSLPAGAAAGADPRPDPAPAPEPEPTRPAAAASPARATGAPH
ncbi:MAG TPA: ATP-binding protein [Myxococcota bacterium]|nr:ATP-binding protein [Myxococcota bacterium]